jgi:hypothetical protein
MALKKSPICPPSAPCPPHLLYKIRFSGSRSAAKCNNFVDRHQLWCFLMQKLPPRPLLTFRPKLHDFEQRSLRALDRFAL